MGNTSTTVIFEILIGWLVIISLVSIIVTVSDKLRAKRKMWRVPENTLMLLSALGGSAAMYLTMLTIRHKTQHIKFMLGIPVIMVLQVIILVWCISRFGLL